jgi:hypothetical protein
MSKKHGYYMASHECEEDNNFKQLELKISHKCKANVEAAQRCRDNRNAACEASCNQYKMADFCVSFWLLLLQSLPA